MICQVCPQTAANCYPGKRVLSFENSTLQNASCPLPKVNMSSNPSLPRRGDLLRVLMVVLTVWILSYLSSAESRRSHGHPVDNEGVTKIRSQNRRPRLNNQTTNRSEIPAKKNATEIDGLLQGKQIRGYEKPNSASLRTDCVNRESSQTMVSQVNQLSNNICDSKIIETAVFIDQALDSKYDGRSGGLVELNKLVLTIMNQVQHLFRYSSMKIPIIIKLVLVDNLKNHKKVPNSEQGDIDAYLSNFCNWQQERLEKERDKNLSWDHAILLSGLDLYKASPKANHTGVLGLAWVGGMCRGNYSCTINEASNLESAFVIAHELGHSMGLLHDGQRNNCDPNGFIMSERTGAGKVHWSRCSISYLNDSIRRNQLLCLETEKQSGGQSTKDSLYDLNKLKAPGQVYSINDQCRLAFGSNYTSFVDNQTPFNAVCRELWCIAGTWAKAAHPALEGSSCDNREGVCREGKCIRAAAAPATLTTN